MVYFLSVLCCWLCSVRCLDRRRGSTPAVDLSSPQLSPSQLYIHDYFQQPSRPNNPFAKSPSPPLVPTPPPPLDSPLELHSEADIKSIHDQINELIASLRCKSNCEESACKCVPQASHESIVAALEQIASVVERNPSLLDNPDLPSHWTNVHRQTQAPRYPQDLQLSLILVPESHKYAAPINLDGLFRHENITYISAMISNLINSISRGRDRINSKSSDMLRALPKSQGIHVVLGLLVVYYAMPNSLGLSLVRRIFDLVIMQNILLMSSWNVVFEYLDESSGCRNSVVPL
eukprot:c3040_g1_i1.p1 GENE.c3040_g1_i1~~c3040_g1_i1.p1  ORF type:complete len:290 (+),score=38.27 c3040_g1_i1:144-1013(+)